MANDRKTAAELRQLITESESDARRFISAFYDEGSFLESGTYARGAENRGDFEGVITGCGAVDGRLVFAFIQDYANGRAAFTAASAGKITALYEKALRAGAPVVGVYSGAGAKLSEGVGAIAGYGAVLAKIAEASGEIPQIAVIAGPCGGAAAVAAGSADFLVADSKKGELYLQPGTERAVSPMCPDRSAEGVEALAAETRALLHHLPSNRREGSVMTLRPEDINRPADGEAILAMTEGDVRELIAEITDDGGFFELAAEESPEAVCGFGAVNGRIVGIVASQPTCREGALTAGAAKKAARLIGFLGRFGVPLLTMVNTVGFGKERKHCQIPALAALCRAYAECRSPKITVVTGKAYGSALAMMGSRQFGADLVFALDTAEISVLPPETAVEFLWEERLKEAENPEAARASLKEEWLATEASPLSAAGCGDIDDIIDAAELRQRIAAAFEVFAAE